MGYIDKFLSELENEKIGKEILFVEIVCKEYKKAIFLK
jgi:hypothetical protein